MAKYVSSVWLINLIEVFTYVCINSYKFRNTEWYSVNNTLHSRHSYSKRAKGFTLVQFSVNYCGDKTAFVRSLHADMLRNLCTYV